MIAWLLIPAGVCTIIYAEKVGNFTGEISFAEKWIGIGGTYTFIKLIGLGMIIFSFMWIVGGLDDFLKSTLGVLVPGF